MKQETREKLERAGLLPAKEKPVPEQQGMVFTLEMLQAMLAEERESNRQQMLEMVREIRKPLPHEQEKIDQEIAQKNQLRARKIRETVEKERTDRSQQLACSHIKQAEGVMKQGHAFRGQVNNDNTCSPICIRCFKVMPKFKIGEEKMKTGMALQNSPNLTFEVLLNAHTQSFPECKECAKGGCAVKDLREFRNQRLDPPPEMLPPGKIRAESISA